MLARAVESEYIFRLRHISLISDNVSAVKCGGRVSGKVLSMTAMQLVAPTKMMSKNNIFGKCGVSGGRLKRQLLKLPVMRGRKPWASCPPTDPEPMPELVPVLEGGLSDRAWAAYIGSCRRCDGKRPEGAPSGKAAPIEFGLLGGDNALAGLERPEAVRGGVKGQRPRPAASAAA